VLLRQPLEAYRFLHSHQLVRNVPLALVHRAVPTILISSTAMAQDGALSCHVGPEPEVQAHPAQPALLQAFRSLLRTVNKTLLGGFLWIPSSVSASCENTTPSACRLRGSQSPGRRSSCWPAHSPASPCPIEATEVVRDGIKRMEKGRLFLFPRAGSGRLGRFKKGPVWPDRLGRSRRSLLVRNTNIINSTLVDSYNMH
jgi:hypothetical protein